MTSVRWIMRLGHSGRGRLLLAVVLGALASGAAIGLAATAAWLISRASEHPPVLYLTVAIVAVRAFGLARGVLRYAERLTGHDASFRILADLRVATMERLEHVLPIRTTATHNPLTTGELLSRFVNDVDGLQDLWVRVLLPYASSALIGVATVAFMFVLVPSASVALALSLVATSVIAPVLSTQAARGAGVRLAPLRADYQSGVLDLFAGATELAVYGALPRRLDRLDQLDRAMTRAEARSAASAGLGAALATLAAGGAMWAGLWFGAGAVEARTLAGVSLAVVALVPLAAHEVFAGLAPAAHQMPVLTGAAARVHAVFRQPPSATEPDVPAAIPAGPYGLHVTALRARWTTESPDVLHDVDLDIEPGSCTLIVGPSGSGKSTLAAVLLRLLDPSAGTVELVGSDASVDLARMSGDDVRTVIGWCAQDAYIFDSTIEANLRLARPAATLAELTDALRQARLDHWVESLSRGLATMVGEHGNHLSGGQRQRLALARVLLADRPIVIFDEPTEHLDEETATALAADLLDAMRERTMIVVTHRPELFPTVRRHVVLPSHSLAREGDSRGTYPSPRTL